MSDVLPEGFEDFEPFLDWALPTHAARISKKLASTLEELTALYELGMQNDRVRSALAYCDQFPLGALPPEGQHLFDITLSMAEVRPQVELYGEVSPSNLVSPTRLPMTSDGR
jgi:hypothetical protein